MSPSTPKDNQATLTRLLEEIWNQGSLALVEEIIASPYTIHHDPGDPWEGQSLDHETFKQRVMYSRKAFPDLHFDVQGYIAAEEKVVVNWFLTGTHQGPLNDVPPTGKKISISGITIYYFESGKVSGHWQVIDQLGFIAQVGLLGMGN